MCQLCHGMSSAAGAPTSLSACGHLPLLQHGAPRVSPAPGGGGRYGIPTPARTLSITRHPRSRDTGHSREGGPRTPWTPGSRDWDSGPCPRGERGLRDTRLYGDTGPRPRHRAGPAASRPNPSPARPCPRVQTRGGHTGNGRPGLSQPRGTGGAAGPPSGEGVTPRGGPPPQPRGCRGGGGAHGAAGRAGLTCAVTMEPRGRLLPRHRKRRAGPAHDALPWQRARPPPRRHFRSDRPRRRPRGPDGAGTKGPPPPPSPAHLPEPAARRGLAARAAPTGPHLTIHKPHKSHFLPQPGSTVLLLGHPRAREGARLTGHPARSTAVEEGISMQYE